MNNEIIYTAPFECEIAELVRTHIHSEYSSEDYVVTVDIPKPLYSFLDSLTMLYRVVEVSKDQREIEVLPQFKIGCDYPVYTLSAIQSHINALQKEHPIRVSQITYSLSRPARIWGDPDDCHEAEYDEHETVEKYVLDIKDVLTDEGLLGISPKFKRDLINFTMSQANYFIKEKPIEPEL